MVADLEELENMDASEVHPRRINAKEVFDDTKGRLYIYIYIYIYSQWQMVQQDHQEETTNSEKPTRRREQPEGDWRSQWRTSRRA